MIQTQSETKQIQFQTRVTQVKSFIGGFLFLWSSSGGRWVCSFTETIKTAASCLTFTHRKLRFHFCFWTWQSASKWLSDPLFAGFWVWWWSSPPVGCSASSWPSSSFEGEPELLILKGSMIWWQQRKHGKVKWTLWSPEETECKRTPRSQSILMFWKEQREEP